MGAEGIEALKVERTQPANIYGNSVPGRGNSQCKVLMPTVLAHSWSNREQEEGQMGWSEERGLQEQGREASCKDHGWYSRAVGKVSHHNEPSSLGSEAPTPTCERETS